MLQTDIIGFEDVVIHNWVKDHVLLELISGKGTGGLRLDAMLARVGINAAMHGPAIAVIEPARTVRDDRSERTLAGEIRSIAERALPQGTSAFVDESGRVCLLFSRMSGSAVADVEAALAHYSPCRVNIGVGGCVARLQDIRLSYGQALDALAHKFYSGPGVTNYHNRVAAYRKLDEYPAELEKRLFDCMKSADSQADIDHAVDEFYRDLLRGGPVVIDDLLEVTARLGVGMEKRVLHEPDHGMRRRFDIISVVSMDTLEQIKQYVGEYFGELKEELSRGDKESHRSIIKKTLQYMEMECQNASLNNVAKKVYMTPTYLSLLFKMNTGKTFIEQLTDIRMNKAKDMLRSTYLKNYEVAERVGYHDSRYFSQIFKKKVGLSPSEYRESVGR